MAVDASWAAELPAIIYNECFEVEEARSATIAPNNSELLGSGLPGTIGSADALQRVLQLVRIVAPRSLRWSICEGELRRPVVRRSRMATSLGD